MYDIIYMWNLKKKNLFIKQKQTQRLKEIIYGYYGRRMREGIDD